MSMKFESDITRLIREIKDDERQIDIWSGLDEDKVRRYEKAIDRKLRLLALLQKGEA